MSWIFTILTIYETEPIILKYPWMQGQLKSFQKMGDLLKNVLGAYKVHIQEVQTLEILN